MPRDVRGKGLAIDVELVTDRVNKTPAVCYRAFELGLLVYYVGVQNNVIEITPPLTISKDEIDKSIVILDRMFRELQENRIDMHKAKNMESGE